MPVCSEGTLKVQFESEEDANAFRRYLKDTEDENGNTDPETALERFIANHGEPQDIVRDYLPGLIDGFSPRTQEQMGEHIRYVAYTNLINILRRKEAQDGVAPQVTPEQLKTATKNVLKAVRNSKSEKGDEFGASELNKALDHFDEFWQRTQKKFSRLGIESENGVYTPQRKGDFARESWEDMYRFTTDPQQTASASVRMVMAHIPDVKFQRDEDGDIVRDEDGSPRLKKRKNYIGRQSFMPMSQVWNMTSHLLADEFPRTFDHFMEVLEEKGQSNPVARKVAQVFKTDEENVSVPQGVKQDFVNAFGKHYAQFKYVMVRRRTGKDQKSPWQNYVGDSDRFQKGEGVIEEWKEELAGEADITYFDDKNAVRVDREAVQRVKTEYANLLSKHDGNYASTEFRKGIRNVLSSLGLSLPMPYLEAMQRRKAQPKWLYNFAGNAKMDVDDNSVMGSIFNALEKAEDAEEDPLLDEVTPLNDSTATPNLRKLAHKSVEYRTDIFAPSFTNVTNKRFYALQDHERLTREIERLRQRPDLAKKRIKDPFQKNSPVLKALAGKDAQNQGKTKEGMGIYYIDGLTISHRKSSATKDNLSPQDQELLSLNLFQNNGADTRLITGPTLSDRSRSYVLEVPNLAEYQRTGKRQGLWDAEIGDDGSVTLASKEKEALYSAALSEIRRIQHVQNQIEQRAAHYREQDLSPSEARREARKDHPLGEDFAKNGTNFFLFPLNPGRLKEDYGQETREAIWERITPDGQEAEFRLKNVDDNYTARETIMNVLADWIEAKTEEKIRQWDGSDVWAKMSDGYIKDQTPNEYDGAKSRGYATLDYQLSHVLGMTEMMRMFHGDPAQFVKDRDSVPKTKEATLGNFQKRLAKAMSPALSHGFGENAKYNAVTLQDLSSTSDQLESYKEVLGENQASMFDGIKSTDAQEYVTVPERIRVGIQYGQMNPEEVRPILERIEQEIEKENYDWNLRKEEIEKLDLAPYKPFYTHHRWDDEAGMYVQTMVKSSSIPLVPNDMRGSELDKIRRAMERSGVDRAAYGSAVKVGQKRPVDLFEDENTAREPDPEEADGKSLAEAFRQSRVTQKRTGFGLQFVIPKSKNEITVSTQMNKLVLGGQNASIEIDGEQMSPQDVYDIKRRINRTIMEMEAQAIAEELGTDLTSEGRLEDPDGEAIKDMVLEEARSRDWSPLQIQEIEDTAAKDFEKPLSFTGAGTKIESLLLSVLTSRIVQRQTHGKSFVQASSAGLQFEDASKTNMVFREGFDPSTGLDGIKMDTDGDGNVEETTPAQIVVPWYFKDNQGNTLDMSNFFETDENGVRRLNEEKMDTDLLEALGFRIPYQGPNSTIPVEIVGFMDPAYYNQAFVPDEIVPQMGSDFDVDKLNTMLRQYEMNDGRLEKIEEQALQSVPAPRDGLGEIRGREYDPDQRRALDEAYLELMMEAAKSPDHVKNVLQPLDRTDLAREKDTLSEGFSQEDFLFPDRQQADYREQLDGKSLVGISSLSAQMNTIFQQVPQEIEKDQTLMVTKAGGGTIEMDQLGQTEKIDSSVTRENESEDPLSAHDAITLFQNAAVDNAKEAILGPLGANVITAEAIFPFLMMSDADGRGPDLEHVTRLMRQPIIEEVQRRIDEQNSLETSGGGPGVVMEVIETIQEELDAEGQMRLPSPEQMLTDIQNPNRESDNFVRRQANYLETFRHLIEVNQDINTVKNAFNFGNRNGPGKSLMEARYHMSALTQTLETDLSNSTDVGGAVLTPESAHHFDPRTEHGDYAQYSFLLADKMFSGLFRYDARPFQSAINKLETLQDDILSEDQRFSVWNEFKASVYGAVKDEITDEDLHSLRRRLLYNTIEDGEKELSLARRLTEARKDGWAKDHPFLEFIQTDLKSESSPYGIQDRNGRTRVFAHEPDELSYNAIQVDEAEELQLTEDLARLLSSTNDTKRELARDLVLYGMYVQGKKRSPRTFDKLIPPAFFREEGITDAIEELDLNTFMDPDVFVEQFLQNNPSNAPQITEENVEKHVQGSMRGPVLKFEDQDGQLFVPQNLREETPRGPGEAYTYLSYFSEDLGRFRLFKNQGGFYEEIPLLGDATGTVSSMTEYTPQQRDAESAVKITANSNPEKEAVQIPMEGEKKTNDQATNHGVFRHHLGSKTDPALEDFLKSVANDYDVDSSLQMLAQLLRRMDRKEDITADLEVGPMGENINGGYDTESDRVLFNTNIDTTGLNSKQQSQIAASVGLHETLHAATSQLLQRAMKKTKEKRTEAMNRMLSLHTEVRRRLKNQRPDEFREFMKKYRRLQGGDNVNFNMDEDTEALFKAAVDPMETLTAFFTNRRFQEWANNQKMDREGGPKSMFEGITTRIYNFVVSFMDELDMEVQAQSLLEEGIFTAAMTVGQDSAVLQNQESHPASQDTQTEGQIGSKTRYSYDENLYELRPTGEGIEVYRINTEGEDATYSRVQGEEADEVIESYRNTARQEAESQKSGFGSDFSDQANLSTSDVATMTESAQRFIEGDLSSLGGTVGEFMNTLSQQQRETFKRLRKHIITKC